MALLDIFGDTPSYYGGLLGEEELQRARDYAQQQALQNTAMALLQAGAPSRTPGGGALAIAQGLQMGQQAYKQAMNESLKDRMTQFQIQDMMQKRAEEQAARQQQAQAQRILQSAYRPEQGMIGETPWNVLRDEEGNLMPDASVRPAGIDFESVMPTLRALGPGGTKVLTEQLNIEKTLSDLAKSKRPEGFTLGVDQTRFEPNAQGVRVPVATGPQKESTLSGVESNIAKMTFGTDNIAALAKIPDAFKVIEQKSLAQRQLSQPKIDLRDPTAVTARQLETIKQWDGVLKETGDTTTAGRASNFYRAYELAKGGNTGADSALIYNLAKVYDPSGAVQQGDVGTIIGNRSIPTQVQLFAQRFKDGGTFTPKERDNMKQIIDSIVEERKTFIAPQLKSYRDLNKRLGGEDESIINPYDFVKKPKSLDSILGR